MVKRKIDHQGRLTIPKELLDTYNISQDDILDVYASEDHIELKKYTPEYYCVITGKVTSNGKMFGKSFISDEGLEIIREFLESTSNKP